MVLVTHVLELCACVGNVGFKFVVDAWGASASTAASSTFTDIVLPWTTSMVSGTMSLMASPSPKAVVDSPGFVSYIWTQIASFR